MWGMLFVYSLVYAYNWVKEYRNPTAQIYIMDFAVFTDFHPSWRVKSESWFPHVEKQLGLTKESCEFSRKIFERSGISSPTHLPPTLLSQPPQ